MYHTSAPTPLPCIIFTRPFFGSSNSAHCRAACMYEVIILVTCFFKYTVYIIISDVCLMRTTYVCRLGLQGPTQDCADKSWSLNQLAQNQHCKCTTLWPPLLCLASYLLDHSLGPPTQYTAVLHV